MEAQIESKGVVRFAETFLLNDAQVAHYWPQIENCLEADDGWRFYHTIDSLREEIDGHIMQVWVAGCDETLTLVVFTRIQVYPVAKSLAVYWVFGHDMDGVLSLVDAALERYAAFNGCDRIEGFGRKGWERKLKSLGGRVLGTTYWRPIGRLREN